ncbi:hypothetical protein V6N13_064062 [Hibiscus sabdariffa]
MPVRCGAYAKSLEKSNDYRHMKVEDRKGKICKFVGWVNHVLIAHQGSTIDEFRVRFYLDKDSWGYVDKWIEIAMKKKITNTYKIDKCLSKVPKMVHWPPHMYLKELEVTGFLGQPMETEIIQA